MNSDSILITGSSGFVGSKLYSILKTNYKKITCLDKVESKNLSFNIDLGEKKNISEIKDIIKDNNINVVVHLAALRNDYQYDIKEYLKDNVDATKILLQALDSLNIEYFLHVSSVAELDGKTIYPNKKLKYDDAYRYTKYLQSKLIQEFCIKKGIELCVLCPSAIFDENLRTDTNIGRLQTITKFVNIFPEIHTKKSLTYLENFCNFIENCIRNKTTGKFVCIEQPILSVSDIIRHLSYPSRIIFFRVPFLKYFLLLLAIILFPLKYLNFDPQLTLNRVVKLFRDTTYENIGSEINGINYSKYNDSKDLIEVLNKI